MRLSRLSSMKIIPEEDVGEGIPKDPLFDTPDPKAPAFLCLDVSGSVGPHIKAIVAGAERVVDKLRSQPLVRTGVALGLVAFGGEAKVVRELSCIDDFTVPPLTAGGTTPLAEAVLLCCERINAFRDRCREASVDPRAGLVLVISDGCPTSDDESIAKARAELAGLEAEKIAAFYAVATPGANVERLQEIFTRKVVELAEFDVENVFKWFGESLRIVSMSTPGFGRALPPIV